MNKKLIRLTEQDIHNIVEKTIRHLNSRKKKGKPQRKNQEDLSIYKDDVALSPGGDTVEDQKPPCLDYPGLQTESIINKAITDSIRMVINEAYDYSLRKTFPRDVNGIALRVGDKVTYYNRTGNYDTTPYRIGGTIENIEKTDEGDGFIVTIQTKKRGTISTQWANHDVEKYNGSGISHNTDDLTRQATNVLFPH